ncbi:MAG: S8 family peptidase [Nitrolancea sp.]
MFAGGLRSLATLVLVISLVGATPAASSANLLSGLTNTVSNTLDKVQSVLQVEVLSAPNANYRVIVKRHNGDTSADTGLLNLGGTKIENLPGDYFVGVLQGSNIDLLAKLTSVDYIMTDALMQTTATRGQEDLTNISALKTIYPETVGATDLWDHGVTGTGVGVAVIDTGIAQVKDFSGPNDGQGRIVAQQNFTDTSSTSDGYGHGTHIAGIIGGDSWWSNKSVQGKYVGTAPDANLLNLKVANGTGQTYTSDVVLAFEWAIAHRAQYNIRVINLSMTSTVPESYHTSVLAAAAEHAWFNGILVVVAAGNYGPNSMVFAPADDPFVVTVGATDSNGTVGPADDWIAPWSSSGSSPDGVTKPDVVAPGRYIASTLAANSQFQKEYPDRVVDQNYVWMSGTSMSTAVVSGVAALIFQAHPNWTNDQVKWLLEQTATPLNVDSVTEGAGEINASAAVNYAGTPGFANQGQAINMNLVGPNGSTTYNNVVTVVVNVVTGLLRSVVRLVVGTVNSVFNTPWSGSAWSGSAWSGSAWSGSAWSGSAWSGSAWSGSAWSSGANIQ